MQNYLQATGECGGLYLVKMAAKSGLSKKWYVSYLQNVGWQRG